MVVIERIYSFPVTGPIMKFVTGLEVLLNKAHVSKTQEQIQWNQWPTACADFCQWLTGHFSIHRKY